MFLAVALNAAALCALGLPASALADERQTLKREAAVGHVVEPAAAPSVGMLLREVPLDMWRFVSLDTAVVLAGGGGAALVTHVWDDDLVREIGDNPELNSAFEPGSQYGAFGVMLGSSFAVYGVGRMAGHRHMAVVGADLVRGQVVSQVWVQALKFTAQRERPDHSNQRSFPSGHAAGAFATAAVLTRHYGWKAAIPAYVGATYIAAARVHDNKHYLSDVTFGAALGLAGARTVMLKAGRYGFHVAPAPVPKGIAVRATLVPALR